MIDVSDSVIGASTTLALTCVGWLVLHTGRLSSVETDVKNLKDRLDRHEEQILASLARIEEKLDKKADREHR